MRKILISTMIGNGLEWYDYALYAQFSHIIGIHFFPESDLADILTFAVFAAGFIVRPLGAVFFGALGDIFGRRYALAVGMISMAIPTAAIGFLPSYQVIGVFAPILLTLMRLIQGFSLGGEFSGCISYVVESSDIKKRGLYGSTTFLSMCLGMLFGGLTAELCKQVMDHEFLVSFGWRIPFFFGLFIGLIGYYIRTKLQESPLYEEAKANGNISRTPVMDLARYNSKRLIIAIGLYLSVTVPFYINTVYLSTHIKYVGFDDSLASKANIAILISMSCALVVSAWISDKIGRKPVMTFACFVYLVLAYPLFALISPNSSQALVILTSAIMGGMNGIFMGPIPTVLVELFPTNIRFTGVALSYNLTAAIFGGTTPMILMILIAKFSSVMIVPYYLTIFICITLVSLIYYKETYKNILNEKFREA
ncbi:MAG: MFS transporter [Rickettsiaceae bacterium]|nr:MFS transporter [Rickettsiaceae bacterium]